MWAVLLGMSVAFGILELCMFYTVIKFINNIKSEDSLSGMSGVITNAVFLLFIHYLAGLMVILPAAKSLAGLLNLYDIQLLSAGGLLVFVFIMVAVSSILKIGVSSLFASNRFKQVALISCLHSIIPNTISWGAAFFFRRLDFVLIAFWLCQILVLLVSFFIGKAAGGWNLKFSYVNIKTMRLMFLHGFNLQFKELSFFVNFHFNKMLIAGIVGITEVAHYEVASRAGLALRSLPLGGIDTFLPSATSEYTSGVDIWGSYVNMTRIAFHSAVLFLLVPVIISPLLLFAWVGEIGYHARWVFMLLGAGMFMSVMAMPVTVFVQAMGRTIIETKIAAFSMILNVILSITLARYWGKEGAAAGTAVAVALTSASYIYAFHRLNGKYFRDTVRQIALDHWPILPISLIWTALVIFITPYVISSRWYMAPASGLLYISCVLTMLAANALMGNIGEDERRLMERIIGLKWIADLAKKNKTKTSAVVLSSK